MLLVIAASPAWTQQVDSPPGPQAIPLRNRPPCPPRIGGIYTEQDVDSSAKLVTPGVRSYPVAYEQEKVGGVVILEFVIDTLGRVDSSSVTTLHATTRKFAAAAQKTLLTSRFQPALMCGQRVAMKAQQRFTFNP